MSKPQNYINGKWVDGSLGTMDMINPSHDSVMGKIARSDARDVDAAVAAARAAFEGEWGQTPAAERGRLLQKAAQKLYEHAEELAQIESADAGKPLTQARGDAQQIARYFEFYAGAADKLHGETIPYQNGFTVYTTREPYGVTGHIIPWNYPLQMTGRTLAPALAAGNATVLKPAEDACLAIVRVFEILDEVGFPAGALNLVTGRGDEAGAALSKNSDIDHLAFTGSPEVGTIVMETMAKNLRPVVLELGGKSPQVVFEDADVEAALPVIVKAIIQNAGQTCSAGSRLLVHESLHDEVVGKLIDRFNAVKVGPAETDPDIGPIISKKQLERVTSLVDLAVKNGAKILAQAEKPEGKGYFYPPTLLGAVNNNHEVAQKEVFGPVLVVIPFKDEAEALHLANNVPYGLVAAVWTRDNGRAHRMVKGIRAGQVFVNSYGAGGGVELPFGGMKQSGFGREKGFEALHHVTTTKTVVINHG
ncbi:MAG: aldehyde dehydrogenase family protein [Bacteroidetes bacterium]|nr:aldehyde dehydrogenase family protein [Bacteroidota bacterium]MCH8524360.1 aldehyde dehydrogenase family protein [Balneolales bacterium]